MVTKPEVPRNLEMKAGDMFGEILKTGVFPTECTVHAVDETRMHGHNPLLRRVLEMFGTSPQATYRTEYSGIHLPPNRRRMITARYHQHLQWISQRGVGTVGLNTQYSLGKYLSPEDPNYSARLHALVIAHNPVWNETSQQVMRYMATIYGPALKYRFNIANDNHDQPGDYNPIIAWMFKNANELALLYLKGADIPHLAAKIAKGNRLIPNMVAIHELNNNWGARMGEVNLAAAGVAKAKSLDATKVPLFPRPGATSITRDFQRLFVDLDPRNVSAIRTTLNEPGLQDKDARTFAFGLNHLHLFLLSLLTESRKPNSTEILPLLDQAVGALNRLGVVLSSIRELAILEDAAAVEGSLTAIDPRLGMSLHDAIRSVATGLNQSPYPGFGAARALLVHHTNLHLNNDTGAQDIEKLMHSMVEIAEGRQVSFLAALHEGE